MNESDFRILKNSERLSFLVSDFLISLLMGCFAISLVQLSNRFFVNWNGNYVVLTVVLISLERLFTYNKIQTLDFEHRIIYHLAEWITFAVGLKFYLYMMGGFSKFSEDLINWQTNFITFFAGEYIPVLVFLFFTWMISGALKAELEELRVESLDLRWDSGILENRRFAAREALFNRILWLGFPMIFAAVLTRLDLISLFGSSAALNAPVINILLYFLAALLLFSQTQFSFLRGRWMWHHAKITQYLGKAWLKYSFIFLALAVLISFILPTSYTYGFLDLLRMTIIIVAQIVLFLFSILFLPFGWLLSLIQGSKPSAEPIQMPNFSDLLPPSQTNPTDPILQIIQSILFWVAMIGVTSFSIKFFITQNTGLFSSLKTWLGRAKFGNLLLKLWGWVHGSYITIGSLLQSIRMRIEKAGTPIMRKLPIVFSNFKNQTPRQRIIFYYFRLLERSQKYGISRKSHQTPTQYASVLETHLPDSKQDIAGMTNAFQEARYSTHEIQRDSSSRVQQFWNRIVRSLAKYGIQ